MEDKMDLYVKIAKRAEQLGYKSTRLELIMDIESADNMFDIRLEDWFNADDSIFMQELNGILTYIVRDTFPAKDFGDFVPRFAR